MNQSQGNRDELCKLDWAGLGLAIATLLSLLASGPGYRLGIWQFKTGISLVKAAGFISAAAMIVCLAGLAVWQAKLFPQGLTPAVVGLGISAAVLGMTLKWKHNLDSGQYIHDISTDTSWRPNRIRCESKPPTQPPGLASKTT